MNPIGHMNPIPFLYEINKFAKSLVGKIDVQYHTDILPPESGLFTSCLLKSDSTFHLNEC